MVQARADRRYRSDRILAADARYVFVRVGPGNLWMRVQICVMRTACPYCKAKVGDPCRGVSARTGEVGSLWVSYTHYDRRKKDGEVKGNGDGRTK